MPLPYNNIKNSKILKHNATSQENHLWYAFLRDYTPKFQRQKTIDSYIVDFYCHEAKLVLEIDGSQHLANGNAGNDDDRTKTIEAYGLQILRITNWQLENDFQDTCNYIDSVVKQR